MSKEIKLTNLYCHFADEVKVGDTLCLVNAGFKPCKVLRIYDVNYIDNELVQEAP